MNKLYKKVNFNFVKSLSGLRTVQFQYVDKNAGCNFIIKKMQKVLFAFLIIS